MTTSYFPLTLPVRDCDVFLFRFGRVHGHSNIQTVCRDRKIFRAVASAAVAEYFLVSARDFYLKRLYTRYLNHARTQRLSRCLLSRLRLQHSRGCNVRDANGCRFKGYDKTKVRIWNKSAERDFQNTESARSESPMRDI